MLLVCGVAISSLAYDRTDKARAYARSGIPAYWIVDVGHRSIVALTDPDPAARRYRTDRTFRAGEAIEAPDATPIAVTDFLPPR